MRRLGLAAALTLAACASPTVDPLARAAPAEVDVGPAPVAGGDETLVPGIPFQGDRVPNFDAAVAASGASLLVWQEADGVVRTRLAGGAVRPRNDVVRDDVAYALEVRAGFAADGTAVCATFQTLLPDRATAHLLPPGAADWTHLERPAFGGATLVAFDPADASRGALRSAASVAHFEKLLELHAWLPSVCRDPLIERDETLAAFVLARGDAAVEGFGAREHLRGLARAGDVVAGMTDPLGAGRVFVRDLLSGEEVVLAEPVETEALAAVSTERGVLVAWTETRGLLVRERGAEGAWSAPVRVSAARPPELRAAARGDRVLLTAAAGGDVLAWLRSGGTWSDGVRLRGWCGVPAFDGGEPTVFRIVNDDVSVGDTGRVGLPTRGTIVRTRLREAPR